MKTNPNQPISAFTELDEQGRPYQFYKGLTKREHFAGLALQGLLANNKMIDTVNWEWIASNSIALADALIAELNRTQD